MFPVKQYNRAMSVPEISAPYHRVRPLPEVPGPDLHQVERLNTGWQLSGPAPADGSIAGRVIYRIRRLLARLLSPQETFNAALVDHINRNLNATTRAQQATLEAVGMAFDDCQRGFDDCQRGFDETSREISRQGESLLALEGPIASLVAARQEARTAVGVLQRATHSLTREIERLAAPRTIQTAPHGSVTEAVPSVDATSLHSYKYVGFEDQFRGTQDDIRQRMADYLPVFAGRSDVLDVGCGRGEFLELLREHGVSSLGIDVNRSMIDVCQAKGLNAAEADALAYLRSQPDASLGGLIATQVVEHLEPRYLTALLEVAFGKLRPGSPIVLETINPACWFAFFSSYIRDITHVRPLHPDTLKYLMVATGFQDVDIQYRAPFPESEKLQPVAAAGDVALPDWAHPLNVNVERLNRLLFTWLDYAAVGYRL